MKANDSSEVKIMNRSRTAKMMGGLMVVVAATVVLVASVPASAGDWGPSQIAVQGELSNLAGEPSKGPVNLQFFIYPSPGAVEPVWTEVHWAVELENGRFSVVLGESVPLDDPPLFEQNPDLWITLSVDGDEEMPRRPLMAVGYSMQAKHADECATVTGAVSDLECEGCVDGQDLDAGAVKPEHLAAAGCGNDQLLRFNGDSWACGDDLVLTGKQVEQYAADAGFAKTGELATVAVSGHYDDLDGIPGDLADGDDDTTYGSGPGLTLVDSTFALDSTGCTAGEVLKRNGDNTAWECVADIDSGGDIATVTAGTGLTGGGDSGDVSLEVAQQVIEDWAKGVSYDTQQELTDVLDASYVNTGEANSVSSTMIVSGAVDGGKIEDGAVENADLAGDSVTSDKIEDGTITGDDLADDSISSTKIKGSVGRDVFERWGGEGTCPDGSDTIYTGFMFAGPQSQSSGPNPVCVKPGDPGPSSTSSSDQMYPLSVDHQTGTGVQQSQSLKCAVCLSQTAPCLTVWGTNTCPDSFGKQYDGYSFGSHYTHGSKNRVCLEDQGSSGLGNTGSHIYITTIEQSPPGQSGPYPTTRALRCAMCCLN